MGTYYEARAPKGAPADGERDVWFEGGAIVFGRWNASTSLWVREKEIDHKGERISNLIAEDTVGHYHGIVDPLIEKLIVKELKMKSGFPKGTSLPGGQIPTGNIDVKIMNATTDAITSINSGHDVVIDIPFEQLKAEDPEFDPDTKTLAFYDEPNAVWVPASEVPGMTIERGPNSFKLKVSQWPTDDRMHATIPIPD
jgi:hypothetical protein